MKGNEPLLLLIHSSEKISVNCTYSFAALMQPYYQRGTLYKHKNAHCHVLHKLTNYPNNSFFRWQFIYCALPYTQGNYIVIALTFFGDSKAINQPPSYSVLHHQPI